MIPRLAHFVFGLRPQREPFHLLHYLAIESCRRVLDPVDIILHVGELPYGVYWDLTRPLVTLDRITPPRGLPIESGPDAHYAYAHQADIARLDVLAAEGGIYADIDTLFIRPVPEDFWAAPAVIGREADVVDQRTGHLEASTSNALLMAPPGAPFITRWRAQINEAMDGSWSGHSCALAYRLSRAHPEEVTVAAQHVFHPFDHTVSGITSLLERPLVPGTLDDTTSMHLCAHLWWDEARRDFSKFSARDATGERLAVDPSPLAVAARPYLPTVELW